MRRVAIFGNAGGGKSTLARELSSSMGLPLHVIDMMQFGPGGVAYTHDEYLEAHERVLAEAEWIIDGFGCMKSAWRRFEVADTLIHVDLPVAVHFMLVTKRLVKGIFAPPPGWPAGSPVFRSSMSSYRVLMPCHRKLTPKYREMMVEMAARKTVVTLRSMKEIRDYLASIRGH